MKLQDRAKEPSICLTEEEAMGLLDIIMMTPADLSTEQRAAMLKLSDFCRQFIRDNADSSNSVTGAGRAALRSRYAA